MKIIVAQKHDFNLEGIKKGVSEMKKELVEKIIFTANPDIALEAIKNGNLAFVVSGQVFDCVNYYGTDLAHKVKALNPNSMFFLYSTIPETNKFIDGIIPKTLIDDHSLLAKILTSNLNNATPESICAAFPEIQRE